MDKTPEHPEMRSNDPSFPTLPTSPVSSSMRKAQVRAALFHKLVPVKIGRFTLLERLGAGSMGEIYAAYDDRLDRAVALKLVRHGSDHTVKADELLLREAQALAQVSHPNVVQIYEAGTHGGRMFIAMELIRGGTLTSWLEDAAQLPRPHRQREILRLFIAAGRGLEAAHSAGVAHRDFKPDNVLVGKDGRVCVVDFGLARVLVDDPTLRSPAARDEAPVTDDVSQGETLRLQPDELADAPSDGSRLGRLGEPDASAASSAGESPKRTAATRLTRTGTVMGTPRFMAPEQIRGGVPDHRSDQFSFCVALYHALYGAFPFHGEDQDQLLDSIRTGVTGLEHSVGLGARLRKALCRGLSVDPSQRFPNMGELLAALEPGLRRRREWIAGAVLLFFALGATGYLLWPAAADPCATSGNGIADAWSPARRSAMQAAFARSDLPYAEAALHGVTQRIDGFAAHWRDEAKAACRATYVDHVQSDQQHDRRMLCLERGSRQVAALATELASASPDAIQRAVAATEATLPDLDACSHTETMVFGLEPPPPGVASQVAAVREQLARALALEYLGRDEEALVIARDAGGTAERLQYPAVHAEALVQIARVLDGSQTKDRRREAEGLYFQALDVAEAARHDQLAATIWTKLVVLALEMESGTQQALDRWRRAEAAVRRINSVHDSAKVHHLRGEIYYRDGKYADAVREEKAAIEAISGSPVQQLELARFRDALARALEHQGKLDEAVHSHERSLDAARDALGPAHPDFIKQRLNYAVALKNQRQFVRARTELEAALASMPERLRNESVDAGRAHTYLSDVSYEEGKLDDAAAHGRTALQIFERSGAPDTRRAEAYIALANADLKRKNFAEALVGYEAMLAIRRQNLAPDHFQIGVNEGSIAEALVGLSRYDDAAPHVREAERILDHGAASNAGTVAWVLTVHGEVLVGQQQSSAAVPVLERALQLFERSPDPSNQAYAAWTLARALHRLGKDPDRVRQLAELARGLFAGQGPFEAANHVAVEQFIERLTPVPASSSSASGRRLAR